ncbi:MAG: NAD(P)/FAD-dependent oxidoreductase [Rubrobacteraceae bacterium]
MTDRADLVVVGAGPAGSATAYWAARYGLDVLLLDRQEFPRDKTCGDGLLPHARMELARMGLDDWLEEPHHGRFDGFSIYTRNSLISSTGPPSFNGKIGYIVRRQETDGRLVERARATGVEFRPGVKAQRAARAPDGAVTGVEATSSDDSVHYEAPLIVVADGVGGFEGDGIKVAQSGVARRQYFKNSSGSHQNHVHFWLTTDLTRFGSAYGWLFYFGDGVANAGVAIYKPALEKERSYSGRNLNDLMDAFLKEPEVAGRLGEPEGPAKSWSLKMGMAGKRRHGQGLLLVGDAGSMIHPLSGEGVGYALESGRLAAAWAHEAHNRKDFSSSLLAGYDRQLARLRGREHKPGFAVAQLNNRFADARLIDHLFEACEQDPEAQQALARAFYGEGSVYELLGHQRALATTIAASARSRFGRNSPNGHRP